MLNIPHFDMLHTAKTLGYIGITLIIFSETGLFFGFFLPGDSLLFTAGLLASQSIFSIYILFSLLFFAAILGYMLAYWIGQKLGAWLLYRKDAFWFKKRYLDEAKNFYSQHGGKALILGRLLPIIRTFVPLVAGMAGLSLRVYCFYNILGALIWVGGLTLLGFFIGQTFPKAYEYLYPLIALIIFISLLPTVWHMYQHKFLKKNNFLGRSLV